jgi:putative membrane protein
METPMIQLHRFLQRCGRLAFAIALLSIPLIAAENPFAYAANEAKTKSGTTMTEAGTFAKKAAIGDMFEIESSKLAASKSTNAEIKKFAQEMIAAHTKTTEQLKSIASSEGFVGELPKEMDQKHAKMVGELKDLSGTKFDRKYVELQVAAHKEAASLFDSYASQGKNAKLKKFAADTAPVIKTHLDHAQMLGKQIPTS